MNGDVAASDNRLLILSCSQRKRKSLESLPAIERYDGPPFRVLRKYLRQQPDQAKHLDVEILSAKYGLIDFERPIANYDQRLTTQRAKALRPQLLSQLSSLFQRGSYTKLLLSMGKDYLHAIEGYQSLLPPSLEVTVAEGTQGRKLSLLHDWLYGAAPAALTAQPLANEPRTTVIRGVKLTMTRVAVLSAAREKLKVDGEGAERYQSWYIEVDNRRVAPKWLVSQLTGLPVSAFGSSEARRALAQLGVEVRRK